MLILAFEAKKCGFSKLQLFSDFSTPLWHIADIYLPSTYVDIFWLARMNYTVWKWNYVLVGLDKYIKKILLINL